MPEQPTAAPDATAIGLPAPGAPGCTDADDAGHVPQANTVKMDQLGPIVVNSDGTLARVPDWDTLTPAEQERTVRILARRNKARLERLRGEGAPAEK
ncbi:hypothetical protein MSPP1_002592 [Malassezia sp. CBS 17886]|nr:hypothetical protein MSPP1_002592 [Malassezia sp. CBS 17886]